MKKLLALVLALVMTLSLCVTSNAAFAGEEYDYDEAVEVMAAVGVFQGDENGKFNGKTELTREQAAKLIAYLDLGEKTAEALPAVKVFNDVEATRWSAKYVAYCADAGYLAGVGDGNFDPAGKLTGYAFGKMVLCVLGYDANIEGLTGSSWSINTAKLMENNGISTGIDTAASATLTREQAAQYCLNALKATMVSYAGGTEMTVNGVTFKAGATRSDVTTAAYAGLWNDATLNLALGTVQLGEKLFGYKLYPDATGEVDDYGRTVTKWRYKADGKASSPVTAATTKVVATAADSAADYTFVATAADAFANATQAAATLKKYTKANLTYAGGTNVMYVNGVALVGGFPGTSLQIGDQVELYTTGSVVDKIVVIRERAAQILKVTANTGKAKTTEKLDDDNNAIVYNYKITLDTNFDGTADWTTNDVELAGYDASTYVENAYLVFVKKLSSTKTTATLDIITSKAVTPVTGKIGAYTNTTAGSKVTIAGSTYTNNFGYVDDMGGTVDFKTGEYAAVIGSNGNVLAINTVDAAASKLTDVVFATGTVWSTTDTKYASTAKTYWTQIVNMDGTIEDIVIGVDTNNDDTLEVGVSSLAAGMYVKTAKSATSTQPAYNDMSATMPAGYARANITIAAGTELKTTDTKFVSKYITSDTVFMQVTGSGETLKAATYTGSMGYKNATAGPQDVYYVYDNSGANANALTYAVIVTNKIATTDANVLYISGSTSSMNGASTYLQSNVYDRSGNKLDAITIVSGDKNVTGFVTYSVDKDGVYDLTAVTPDTIAAAADWSKSTGTKYFFNDGTTNSTVAVSESFYSDRVNLTKTNALSDIPAANAAVVDLRSSSNKSAGYDADLASVADIITATKTIKSGTTYWAVTADVYLNADGVATIFVKDVA